MMSMSTVLVGNVTGLPPLKKVFSRKRRAVGICSTASNMVRVSKISIGNSGLANEQAQATQRGFRLRQGEARPESELAA